MALFLTPLSWFLLCGGQRTAVCVIPQVSILTPPPIEARSLTSLELAKQVEWVVQ